MALFDSPTSTLEDVLGQQADTASNSIMNQYAKARKKLVSQQAAGGRLRSGVSNYQFGDLAAGQLGDLGGVQSSLAEALGQIPTEDYLGARDFQRNLQLSKLIAEMQKPSTLSQVFGGIGAAGNLAAIGAAFG